MTPENLRQEFDYIRQTFFPRWDTERSWKIRLVRDLDGASGYCDLDNRVIKLIDDFEASYKTIDHVHGLIIHEIAHAVTNAGHGKKWQGRMEKAAQRADAIGKKELAKLLRVQVESYVAQPTVGAGWVYAKMKDALLGQPDAGFLVVVDWVRRQMGMSRADFFKLYRRCRVVFDEARAFWKAEEHSRRGREFSSEEKYEQALAEYEQAVAYDPFRFMVHHEMAVAYNRLRRDEEAISELECYLALAPSFLKNREETEKLIEQLREQLEEGE